MAGDEDDWGGGGGSENAIEQRMSIQSQLVRVRKGRESESESESEGRIHALPARGAVDAMVMDEDR